MTPRVQTGLARLLAGDSAMKLQGRRVALLANQTATDANFRHALDGVGDLCDLVALFGPEHGIRGDAQDMISVDTLSGDSAIPTYSLYGSTEESLTPTPESLRDLDVMVYDIQDVGSRYYTYVWTMVLAMRACAKAGVDFVVLDRPNPIGGVAVEGGEIAEGFDSFVGLRSLPNRHGLSAGEIATWAMREEKLDLNLEVVLMEGWQRSMTWADTGLPWIQPSPNMPTVDTALVYPGMCLVEGTEASEGRGWTRPFEVAGAPYVDPDRFAALLHEQALPGVVFRPLWFLPMFQKCANQLCGGVQQHITNYETYLPYRTGVAFVWALHKLWKDDFSWRSKAYEFVDKIPAFDLLTGSAEIREGIESGVELAALAETWRVAENEFRKARRDWPFYK